jgi:hypothetical protein
MRVGHEKRFKSRRRPYGLITHPTAAPQFCQLGSQQFQQSFTVNSDPMKISNVNDYFNAGKFSPLFSPCQALFSLALLEQPETTSFYVKMHALSEILAQCLPRCTPEAALLVCSRLDRAISACDFQSNRLLNRLMQTKARLGQAQRDASWSPPTPSVFRGTNGLNPLG